jgi:hypothetical protein
MKTNAKLRGKLPQVAPPEPWQSKDRLRNRWNVTIPGQPNTGDETIMRVAYLTLDEVNQHLALAFAAEHDVRLDVYARPEAIGELEYGAVLYDPDSFPPEERQANFTTVLDCPLNRPVAVHSYNFSADQLRVLRRRGAIVARRLRSKVFARLVSAARAAQRRQTVA